MKELSNYEYGRMCSEILEAVGGKSNIKNVFHCITRLRIVPVNRELVNMEKLNQVSGLLKVIESSGQIQCVVGRDRSGTGRRENRREKAKFTDKRIKYAGFLRNSWTIRHRSRRYD